MRSTLAALRRVARARHLRALARFSDLNAFERKIYSQNGEDGILHELLFRVGRDRYFVEFGVWDGSECNTALLAEWYGWHGLLIEGDPILAEGLRSRHRVREDDVKVMCEFITRENIVDLFRRGGVPEEFDFLSIDIDGNDYWVWEALDAYRPRVVVIEYNGSLPAQSFWIMRYNPAHEWDKTLYYGASLAALEHLGLQKGYALLGTDSVGINAFFVRRDLLLASRFPERTAAQAYRRPGGVYSLFPSKDGPAVTDPAQLTDKEACGRWIHVP